MTNVADTATADPSTAITTNGIACSTPFVDLVKSSCAFLPRCSTLRLQGEVLGDHPRGYLPLLAGDGHGLHAGAIEVPLRTERSTRSTWVPACWTIFLPHTARGATLKEVPRAKNGPMCARHAVGALLGSYLAPPGGGLLLSAAPALAGWVFSLPTTPSSQSLRLREREVCFPRLLCTDPIPRSRSQEWGLATTHFRVGATRASV
jgi:hypothetical protein